MEVPALKEVKENIQKSKRMQIKNYYLCDRCNTPIYQPESGFIVHGNIYVADTTCRGGLIGNNFPEVQPGEKIEITDVQESVFCKNCFFSILGNKQLNTRRDTGLPPIEDKVTTVVEPDLCFYRSGSSAFE